MRIANMSIDTSMWGWLKSAFYFIAVAVGSGITYIGVEQTLVYTFTGLMIVDWFAGVVKARRLKIDVTSKKGKKGIIEKVALLIIPISIGVTLKAINVPIGITIEAAFTMLAVAELYSLISNLYCIYTRTEVKEYDAVTAVIRFIRNSVVKVLKAFLSYNNKDNQNNQEP